MPQQITPQQEGDVVGYVPEMVHSWEMIGDTLVLTVRFPSVEVI